MLGAACPTQTTTPAPPVLTTGNIEANRSPLVRGSLIRSKQNPRSSGFNLGLALLMREEINTHLVMSDNIDRSLPDNIPGRGLVPLAEHCERNIGSVLESTFLAYTKPWPIEMKERGEKEPEQSKDKTCKQT